ncbi:MAG: hypothetical protein IIZ39_06830 [Blautia sp.]|nr:hypothetical protein [Blautia sp.]
MKNQYVVRLEEIIREKMGDHPLYDFSCELEGDMVTVSYSLQPGSSFSLRGSVPYQALESNVEQVAEKFLEEVDAFNGFVRKGGLYLQDGSLNMNFDEVSSLLFVRALPLSQMTDQFVYRVVGDIALVAYLRLRRDENGLSSIKLPAKLAERWEKTQDEVMDVALENTLKETPPVVMNLQRMLQEMGSYEGENLLSMSREEFMSNFPMDFMGICVTIKGKLNGAVAPFLPGVAKFISDCVQGSYYLVFTSIHEVMIHKLSASKVDHLVEVLGDTLRKATDPDELLSRQVYVYNRKEDKISLASLDKEA